MRCCAVLVPRRGSWHFVCFPAPRCLSGRRRWFNHEASLVGRVLREWSWRVSRACRSIRCWRTSRPTLHFALVRSYGGYTTNVPIDDLRNNATRRQSVSLDLFTSAPSPELRARVEPALASRVHDSLRPTFSTRRLQHRAPPRSPLACWRHSGSSCSPAVGGILMIVSTITVAINA